MCFSDVRGVGRIRRKKVFSWDREVLTLKDTHWLIVLLLCYTENKKDAHSYVCSEGKVP